jgi:hypothetical protein
MKRLPFTPQAGQLVIIKGGIVGRIVRVDADRVALTTWYPTEVTRLVPFDDLLDLAERREAPPAASDADEALR